MRILKLFCLLLLSSTTQSQNLDSLLTPEKPSGYFSDKKKDEMSSRYLQIQNAYVIGREESNKYQGFNYANLGIGRKREKEMQGINLEGFLFDIDERAPYFHTLPDRSAILIESLWNFKRFSIEANGYRLFKVNKSQKLELYLGPLVSLGFFRERFFSRTSKLDGYYDDNLSLGLGGRISIELKLTKRMALNFGTKLNFLNFGFFRFRDFSSDSPAIHILGNSFKFKFLNTPFYFPFGLTFLLEK